MNYELAENAKYLYCVWVIVWIGIYVINAMIYKYYQEKEEQKYYVEDPAPDDKLLFTLWWNIESKENDSIMRLKKAANRLSICFGGLTLVVIAVIFFLLHTSPAFEG